MQTAPLCAYRCFLPNLAGFTGGVPASRIIPLSIANVKSGQTFLAKLQIAALPSNESKVMLKLYLTISGLVLGLVILANSVTFASTPPSSSAAEPPVKNVVIQLFGDVQTMPYLPDNQGKYQLLWVRIPLAVSGSGIFSYTANLKTQTGQLVATVHSRSLLASVSIEQLTFYFDGGQIAASGLNGPYKITDFIIRDTTTGQEVFRLDAPGTTETLQASQFAGCSLGYTVKLDSDEGTGVYCGTLSYATEKARTATQDTTISFSGVDIVTLLGELPPVGNQNGFATTLDGGCQPDSGQKVPVTTIYGVIGARRLGLTLTNRVTLHGFRLFTFEETHVLITGSHNLLTCNWIGNYDGLDTISSTGNGLVIGVAGKPSADYNQLGLAGAPESGNLIGGNGLLDLLVLNGKHNSSHYTVIGVQREGTPMPLAAGRLKVSLGSQLTFGLAHRIVN